MKVEFSDTHPTKSFPIYRNYNNLNESVLQWSIISDKKKKTFSIE
jgi:hypothetical protein